MIILYLNNYIDLKDFKYSSGSIKERRLELQRYMKTNLIESLESLESINNGGGVLLSNLSYEEVPIETDSVIYCDPPYKNTNTYIDDFNHERFYEWLRDCRKHNQQIFISEYQMPNDFFEVYYKEKTILINAKTTTFKQEKLFSTLKYSPIELFEW